MLTHPIIISAAVLVAIAYIGGAFLMLQMRNARPGYEDEEGFHFADPLEEAVVPADEERPAWLTGSLAERFCGHRAEIFAGAA
jgi:hypothetical protein